MSLVPHLSPPPVPPGTTPLFSSRQCRPRGLASTGRIQSNSGAPWTLSSLAEPTFQPSGLPPKPSLPPGRPSAQGQAASSQGPSCRPPPSHHSRDLLQEKPGQGHTDPQKGRAQSQGFEGAEIPPMGGSAPSTATPPSQGWVPTWPSSQVHLSLNNPHLSRGPCPHPAPALGRRNSLEVRGQWLFSSCSSLDVLFVERIVFFPALRWRLTRAHRANELGPLVRWEGSSARLGMCFFF